jgi:L-iditol 2-dehydrogenase
MKALYKTDTGMGNIELLDASIPEPGPGEVCIEVKAAGICGSDLHIYDGSINIPIRPPVIIGHEFAGTIHALGEGVGDWRVGDRITSETSITICGKCFYCRTGFYNLCPDRTFLGYSADGAFAEFTVVPSRLLHRLPDNISFREGALSEPLACCVHGVVELTDIAAGDRVVIFGPGAIGLLSMLLAKAAGGIVLVAGISKDADRLLLAKELGADHTVDIETEDLAEIANNMSGNLGADVVIECSGAGAAAAAGLDLVRKRGQFTQVGLFGKPITVDFEKIAYKEIRVTGSFSQKWSAWEKSLTLLGKGIINIKPLISDVFPISEWKTAFEKFESGEGLKILLDPKQ